MVMTLSDLNPRAGIMEVPQRSKSCVHTDAYGIAGSNLSHFLLTNDLAIDNLLHTVCKLLGVDIMAIDYI